MNKETQTNNFLKYLTLHGVSDKSLKYYKSDLVGFLTWATDKKITQELIQEYINSIRVFTNTATLNRKISTLKSFSSFMGFKKVAATWQEHILNKFSNKPKAIKLLNNIFFYRPNWYKKYHSYPLANYIHVAILVLFTSVSGYALYDQVFKTADNSLAFPAALTRPNRYMSFQGRLTDNLGNPKTVATDMVFKLYSVSTGGAALWDSGTCSITPDQDGVFSTLLGSSCGAEIAATVFSENAAIWLGATMGADAEATPRVQIATVAYSLNSETLQGYPAGTGTSTIPYINSAGSVVLANASPKIQSTSGTFAVEGLAMTITTPNASDGVITVNPDGVGTLDLVFEGAAAGLSANGFLNATNANITSGALYGGTVKSTATGYNFINFLGGDATTPTSKFSVSAIGNTTMAGDLTVTGDDLFMGTNTANYFLMADGTNYNPTTPAAARTGLGLDAGGTGDVWVEKAGDTMTGALTNTLATGNSLVWDTDTLIVDATNHRVGIGTTAPESQLEILKTGTEAEGPMLSFRQSSTGINLTTDYILGEIKFAGNDRFTGEDGVGAKIGAYADQYWQGTTGDYPSFLSFFTTPDDGPALSERMRITSTGFVGIGTTAPTQKLDVVGNIEVPTTTFADQSGIVYKGADRFIHNFNYGLNGGGITTLGNNTFTGVNSGNFTMGSTAIATYQGSYNTGSGVSTLPAVTTGYHNTALGYQALLSDTTGYGNTAVGSQSLNSTNTGAGNAAIGQLALRYNQSGNNNIGIGQNAGTYITGGATANLTSDFSLYLGTNTKGLADNDQNEIVIGYDATGIGSNTVTLGADTITTTALKGKVGIGTTAPATLLALGPVAATSSYITVTSPANYGAGITFNTGGNASVYSAGNAQDIRINVNAVDVFTAIKASATANTLVLSAGKVGMGTTAPASALHIVGSTGVTIGEDKTAGTTNTTGTLKIIGAGDNAFSTTFTGGTQTADATYTLPTAMSAAATGYFLTSDTSGVMSWSNSITASALKWSQLTAPDAALTLAMGTNATTFGWTPTAGLDAMTYNIVNNGGSATTQNGLVINNAVAGSFTDTTTENLLLVQQLDTTTAGTTIVTNGIKVDSAASSAMTNGITITNSAGDLATGLNIVDTAGGTLTTGLNFSGTFTKEISLSNAETIDNTTDGTIALTAAITSLSGNLKLVGGQIANSAGTAVMNLSATPAASSNTLSGSNWTVYNNANVGEAALIVDQTKLGDLFTASVSGVTKMSINPTGDINLGYSGTSVPATTNPLMIYNHNTTNVASIDTAGLLTLASDIAINGGDITSTAAAFNFLDNTTTKTIDIGGVTLSAADTINIATNETAADFITIGNVNAATQLTLTGGENWNMAETGILTLSANSPRTTAVILTDVDYTNSLSIGDNNIIGTTANIDLTNFDVVGSTGSITTAGDIAINGNDITSTGALTITPNAGANLNIALSTTGDFTVNTSQFYVDTSTGFVGIGTAAPTNALSFNNDIAQKIWIESSAAGTTGRNLLIESGSTTAGSADVTGGNLLLKSGVGTGTGSSNIFFQTGTTLTTGTTLQTVSTKMTIAGSGAVSLNQNTTSSTVTLDLDTTTSTFGVCHSGITSATNDVILRDCSTTPTDIAEFYPSISDTDPGDLLTLIPDSNSKVGYRAIKTTNVYDQNIIGAISTTPSGPNGSPLGENTISYDQNPQAIGLSGRVPIKVSLENGPILINDWLTSSSTPGVAMKATKYSRVIGKALEKYDGSTQVSVGTREQEKVRKDANITVNKDPIDPPSGIGKILVFTNPTHFDPDLAINSTGDVTLNGSAVTGYSVATSNGITDKIGSFASATVAKLIAGVGSFGKVETNLISPVANADLIIDLQPDNSQNASKLAIKGENDEIVASIDTTGKIESNSIETNDATISGTLYADNIESEKLKNIEKMLTEVESNQNLLSQSTSWNINTATESGQFTDLFATGQVAFTNLFVSDSIAVKAFGSLDTALSIQPLAQAPIEMMAGKIKIETSGDVTFQGNVEVAGNLKLDGNFIVAADALNASPSGEIIIGETNSNSTAGTAKLAAGLSELKIKNSKIKENSLIYVTPISSTQNKVLFVKSKDAGMFTVGFSESIDTDVEFNWWIIDLGSI